MSTTSFDVSDISGANRAHEPAAPRTPGPAPYRDEDFPGCESFPLPASGLEHYEGRLEFWDGATETAWKVCEPTSVYHEEPSRLLAQMAGQFAMLRGSRIATFRLGGPVAGGRGGAQALADAGRRGAVPAS